MLGVPTSFLTAEVQRKGAWLKAEDLELFTSALPRLQELGATIIEHTDFPQQDRYMQESDIVCSFLAMWDNRANSALRIRSWTLSSRLPLPITFSRYQAIPLA